MSANVVLDSLIFLNIYGYYILVAIPPVVYYIWLKIFSFPLITRKSHELLLIITPEKVKIKKIKSRLYPFFSFCKGLYWFSDPFDDVDSNNKFHVYIEGINQSLGDMEIDGTLKRRSNKLDELTTDTEKLNEIKGHSILLPKNLKGQMHRHYQITIDPLSHLLKISPVATAQSLKYSFWHTIGIVLQTPEIKEPTESHEIETDSSQNQKLILTNLTSQTMINKIKFIQEYKYYSSFSAYTLLRRIRRANTNFVRWVLGSMNPMIFVLLIMVFGGIALVYFGMPLITPKLGEMPTN